MKKRMTLNETLKELKGYRKIINEAYDMGQDEMQQQQDPRLMQQQGQQPQGMMGEEGEEAPMQQGMIDDVIDKIRQLAIQGIAKYADDVESETYQNLKKIWLLTDKVYEEAMGDNDKKK